MQPGTTCGDRHLILNPPTQRRMWCPSSRTVAADRGPPSYAGTVVVTLRSRFARPLWRSAQSVPPREGLSGRPVTDRCPRAADKESRFTDIRDSCLGPRPQNLHRHAIAAEQGRQNGRRSCWDVPKREAGQDFSVLARFSGGAAGNRTRVLRHSLEASPCAVR